MTQPMFNETAVRDMIRQELPVLIRENREIHDLVVDLGRKRFADRDRTERRIEQILDELRRDRERSDRKWEEQRAEDKRRWDENSRRREEHIQENRQEFERLHEEIARTNRSVSALGARWGIKTERSFRDALAAILEKSFGVKVINVNEFDAEGTVFGRPEQVELDVVIHNGTLILIEIKSPSVRETCTSSSARYASMSAVTNTRRTGSS